MFVDIGNLKVHYEVAGCGEPLVLVHGAGADSGTWEEMVPYLAPSFTVLRYDLRGFGRTVRPPDPRLSFDVWTSDLGAFLDSRGISRASLFGWSLGGLIVLHFAARHPERVRHAIAMGTPSPLRAMDTSGFEERRRLAESGASIAAIIERTFSFTRAAFSPWTLENRPTAVEKIRQALLRNEPRDYAETIGVFSSIPALAPKLRCVYAPTLLLVGDADRRTPLQMSEDLCREIEPSYLKIIPDCGHYYGYEQPELASRIASRFLQRFRSE